MRRLDYYQLAVKLTKRDLRQLDLLLHRWMSEELDGHIRASYIARTSYISVEKDALTDILTDEQLPDTIHELEIRLEDNRRSIRVRFSPAAVITRVMGGANDEFWEEHKQTQITKFLREKKAKFLRFIFAPVPFLLGGGIYTLMGAPLRLGLGMFVFYLGYIATSFVMAGVCWLHKKGIGLPHARIVLRTVDTTSSNSAISILNVLNLIIQLVRLFFDYFYSFLASPYKLWHEHLH
jgi:hypothetical protein